MRAEVAGEDGRAKGDAERGGGCEGDLGLAEDRDRDGITLRETFGDGG